MVNKKIILGILTIGMLATVAGAGTWAVLSSVDGTEDETINTGTIILSLDEEETWTFDADDILPGEATSASFSVDNTGTREGYLFIKPIVSGLQGDQAVTIEYSTDGNNFSPLTNDVEESLGMFSPADAAKEITIRVTLDEDSTYNLGSEITVSVESQLNQNNEYYP